MKDVNILLLRGVNLGGANRLPMPELRQYLSELGCTDVQTYLQSGNVVFRGPVSGLQETLAEGMKLRFGFAPHQFYFNLRDYAAILAANPYEAQGAADGTKVHIFFLAKAFDAAAQKAISALAVQGEAVSFSPRAVYLHAPAGIGRSKLAQHLGDTRKVDLTARNINSTLAIAALARAMTV